MRRLVVLGALAVLTLAATVMQTSVLPTGWRISAPTTRDATIGTMPQGIALSNDGTKLAVIEGGFNPPALRILAVPDLHTIRVIPLTDAFGSPVWVDNRTVLVPGASTDAVLSIDTGSGASLPWKMLDRTSVPSQFPAAHWRA